MTFLADLPPLTDCRPRSRVDADAPHVIRPECIGSEAERAKRKTQQDVAERIADTATDLAYEALDSADPAGRLELLGWTSGDVLPPYDGQPAEYLDSIVLRIIRDVRKGDATHKDAIQRLIRLGNRIAEAASNSERCVAEAHSDVINSFISEG